MILKDKDLVVSSSDKEDTQGEREKGVETTTDYTTSNIMKNSIQ
jgi:hypothetical protein